MNPAGVHEHGREKRWKISNRIGKEARRYESPAVNKSVSTAKLQKEDQYIYRDQDVGDYWSKSAGTIIITNRQHKIFSSLNRYGITK
jgi:hypothetical protein